MCPRDRETTTQIGLSPSLVHFLTMKIFHLFLISSLLFSFSRAEDTGSVFFIDSSTHQFLRTQSTGDVAQSQSMLLHEVGAAVSVLLGFAPPTTLSAAGSSKLNEVLIPNPFDRPRAVFLLEVTGIDDPLVVDPKNALFINALKRSVDLGSRADIQLPDEEEVSVISLDEPLGDYTEEEINDFASWLGGSYVTDATEPLQGVLTIPLANGDNVNLHMSKKVHREFASKLLALSHNIRKAMKMHADLSQTLHRPAELIMGSFDAIKALQEQHDADGINKQGMRLQLATISKIFDSLLTAYEAIVFNGVPQPESKTLMNVMFTSRPSPRWLAEKIRSQNTTDAAQVLVRRTLAWVTGLVLVIATLLGVYFLLNMPLTRDTLLYSNVKLD
ncbi:Type 1 membrane protein, putative isoform 2 [Theobroma cacao]|uniref:Type 1 membrane protein, putative isoform 2 n=1 Tax=Theobroma cacao TaxID=3641 RepID=A0A061ELT1_THECC|nr:Type 1 membrane protein, putative isoform 2 [Theobroma cacao]